jgi:hypothetical protein
MQVFDHHVIFDEITYDREELKEWYNSVKKYTRTFADVMNTNQESVHRKFPKGTLQTVDTYSNTGLHILDYEPVKKLVKQFNFDQPLEGRAVDVLVMRKGTNFKAHVDFRMHCGIMFPILPDEGAEPIDFYQMPLGCSWERSANYEHKIVFERDFLYSYHYNMQHPSMFNGDTIHGVRQVKQERVFLRFKCYSMTFEQVINKAIAGNLILPQ